MKNNLHSDDKPATKLLLHHDKRYYWTPWHAQIFQQICNIKPVQKRNIFPVFGSKESELIHVKHSTIEQNLLQVTTCLQSKLNKIGRLGYQLKYMSNKKVCRSTDHNNFLTVISKEVALQYQTAANLLKDAISDSIPTSCE